MKSQCPRALGLGLPAHVSKPFHNAATAFLPKSSPLDLRLQANELGSCGWQYREQSHAQRRPVDVTRVYTCHAFKSTSVRLSVLSVGDLFFSFALLKNPSITTLPPSLTATFLLMPSSSNLQHIDDHGALGYGCYNVRNLTPAQQQQNADNYAWWASEVYWTRQRNGVAMLAPTQPGCQCAIL